MSKHLALSDTLNVLMFGIFYKKEKYVYPTDESRKSGKRFNKEIRIVQDRPEQLEQKQKTISSEGRSTEAPDDALCSGQVNNHSQQKQ